MKVYREMIEVTSGEIRPTFYQVTPQVKEIVERSGVQNGICVVYSHHTTCSVITQEDSFDRTYKDYEFLQQDLLNVFESIIPTTRMETQYMHPGPKLTEFADSIGEGKPLTMNTDAHLRSSILGRSESIVIVNGKLDMGQFGHVYFIDFDQTRVRTRQIQVQIIGE